MRTVIAVLLATMLSALPSPLRASQSGETGGQRALHDYERTIDRRYSRVRSILPDHFEQLLEQRSSLLILDVREPEEFGVSRIPDAILVNPNISQAEFVARFGDRLAGKVVVLYCSVGVRSSVLAQRVEQAARQSYALGVFNLRGGIFAWHNTGRTLLEPDGSMPVREVHGYDRRWSRFVDFDNYVVVP